MKKLVDGLVMPKEVIKMEALGRMKRLKVREDIIDAFLDGKLLCSDGKKVTEVPPKILKEIQDWVDDFDNMVYHVVYGKLSDGRKCYEIYNALCVSRYGEDWEYENMYIDHGITMVHAINITKPEYTDSGSVQFKNNEGLLERIR